MLHHGTYEEDDPVTWEALSLLLRVVSSPSISVKAQHAALERRIRGHFNYFGVSGNFRSLLLVTAQAKRSWYKWLCRRSQRTRLTWERFTDLLRDFPLPRPRITVQIRGT